MKYNKFIKKSNKNYLLVILCSILLFIGIFYFYIRGTYASFGGVSGEITITKMVSLTFHSNYPKDAMLDDMFIIAKININTECDISENQFPVPDGYMFVGWNSLSDGTGISYNKKFTISNDMEVFAIWSKVEQDDDSSTDTDSDITVNPDEETDLPNDNDSSDEKLDDNNTEENGNIDDNLDNENNNEDDKKPTDDESDINIGTGNLGSGGTGNSSNGSSSNGNNNSNNKPSNTGGNNVENNKTDDTVNKDDEIFYKFKYMDGNYLYEETVCKVLKDGDTCDLVLPGINPSKEGHVFSGWSLDEECNSLDIVTKSRKVNSSNTYYACYINNTDKKTGLDYFSVIISIITMWGVTIVSIVLLIKRFIKNNSND